MKPIENENLKEAHNEHNCLLKSRPSQLISKFFPFTTMINEHNDQVINENIINCFSIAEGFR